MAPNQPTVKHFWQLLHSDGSIKTGSSRSILKIASTLHTNRASQGSQVWQICQSTSGLFKSKQPPRVNLAERGDRVRFESSPPSDHAGFEQTSITDFDFFD